MKTINFLRMPALVFMLTMAACSKNNNDAKPAEAQAALTTGDAVVMLSSNLAVNSYSMVSSLTDATGNAQDTFNANPGCGGTKTYNFTRQNQEGTASTYNYTFNYINTLNCLNNAPDNVTSVATSAGSFDGPSIATTNTGGALFTVSGLVSGINTYSLMGDYKRSGSYVSKTGDKTTGSNAIDITLTNLNVNKSDNSITSGVAVFTLTGNNAKGSFTFNGTITFSGNNEATVVINGNTYVINLLTGDTTIGS